MQNIQVENKYRYKTGIPKEKAILLATVRIGALNNNSIIAASNINPLRFFAVIFMFAGNVLTR
jgi:hypothetical protein